MVRLSIVVDVNKARREVAERQSRHKKKWMGGIWLYVTSRCRLLIAAGAQQGACQQQDQRQEHRVQQNGAKPV